MDELYAWREGFIDDDSADELRDINLPKWSCDSRDVKSSSMLTRLTKLVILPKWIASAIPEDID